MGPPSSSSLPGKDGSSADLLGSAVSRNTDHTVFGLGSWGRKDKHLEDSSLQDAQSGMVHASGQTGTPEAKTMAVLYLSSPV